MSPLRKALAKLGIRLERGALPKGKRTVKVVAAVIEAVWESESEFEELRVKCQDDLNAALQKNLELQDDNTRLHAENLRLKMKDHLDRFGDALPLVERNRLLALAASDGPKN
jgi:hypothetical protein